MPFEGRIALGLLFAVATVYAVTPLAIRLACKLEFYDKPVGYKGHARPTPYLGGAAVMIGFCVALLAVAGGRTDRTLPLLGGMLVLWAVGTLDDRLNISPWIRVAVEIVLGWAMWRFGLGWDTGLGWVLDLALTVGWLVAVINAFNLFDNMDGAASTMALVSAVFVAVLGVIHHDRWLILSAAVLGGSCIGFLPHNLASPARIFLGDGGSMPMGFAVAMLVMIGAAEAVPAGQSLLLGLLLVGVPATDTALVIFSRRRRGISVLSGGRDHLTHRTRQRFQTARAVAMALGGIQALVSAIALFAIIGGLAGVLVVGVLYVVAGATAIALLEARHEPESFETQSAARAGLSPRQRQHLRQLPYAAVLIGFGAIAGASPFSSGFYSEHQWVPVGLVLLVVVTAGGIALRPRLTRPAVGVMAGLAGMAAWALISSAWAPSVAQATTEGNRWFVLAAVFATAAVLVRGQRSALLLAGGLAAGIAAVAAYVLLNLLGSDPIQLYLSGRLNQPLGYVNAEATVFLMGFWLWFSLTGQSRVWLRATGLGMATLMAGLVLMSQSRGAALALVGSVLVVAAIPGRRLARVLAFAVVSGAIAAISSPLLDLYSNPDSPASSYRHAGLALLAAALVVTAAWWGCELAYRRLTANDRRLASLLPRVATIALVAIAVTGAGVALARAGRIDHYVSTQWTAFTHLEEPSNAPQQSQTLHLVSGAGTRYDYWRIAWHAFESKPLNGVGAGNYDRPYFKSRRTTEDVKQPHSMELQTLSELGIVGGAILAVLMVSLTIAIVRGRRLATSGEMPAVLALGGAGVVTTWLIHTSVDWIHLIPGVTAIPLAMAAVMLRHPAPAGAARATAPSPKLPRFRLAVAGAVLASVCVVVAGASLSREGLADYFRDRASNELSSDPGTAINEANRSLRLDSEVPETYYIKAAAQARFDQADAARSTLLQAASKEPDNFVTWALLGDLAVRRHHFGEAKRNYSRALALNPLDPSLQSYAADPRKALPSATP